jgi:hypothetical protein
VVSKIETLACIFITFRSIPFGSLWIAENASGCCDLGAQLKLRQAESLKLSFERRQPMPPMIVFPAHLPKVCVLKTELKE